MGPKYTVKSATFIGDWVFADFFYPILDIPHSNLIINALLKQYINRLLQLEIDIFYFARKCQD